MSDTKRYGKRSATAGSVTLNSSRKCGNTMTFWFFIKIGRKWIEFDVREVAAKLRVDLPQRMTMDEVDEAASNGTYESLLLRDLQRTADWCEKHKVIDLIKSQVDAPSFRV